MNLNNKNDQVEILNQYLDSLEKIKNYSPNTVKSYKNDILQYLKEEIVLGEFAKFLKICSKKEYSKSTINRKITSIKTFLNWCIEKNYLNSSALKSVKNLKNEKKLPNVLTANYINELLDGLPTSDAKGLRDKAILEIMYSSGLRVSEVSNLTLKNFKKNKSIKVLGKGNKFRIVPLGRKAIEALDLWILQRNKLNKLVDAEFLFLNQQGRKLTARAIQYRLKFWAQKNNIPENIHPHLLRHSFASHVLQSSQDLRAVQELLGHSNISTTQIYTHLDFQHLSKIYDQAHPRSKKKID